MNKFIMTFRVKQKKLRNFPLENLSGLRSFVKLTICVDLVFLVNFWTSKQKKLQDNIYFSVNNIKSLPRTSWAFFKDQDHSQVVVEQLILLLGTKSIDNDFTTRFEFIHWEERGNCFEVIPSLCNAVLWHKSINWP